jgi:hypothetical protein
MMSRWDEPARFGGRGGEEFVSGGGAGAALLAGENPFATCRVKPGAIGYVFPAGTSIRQIAGRLNGFGGWGEITGPHGTGKSTLIATLLPELPGYPDRVVHARLIEGDRRLAAGVLRRLERQPAMQLVVDGYEQLGRLARRRLKRLCRRQRHGLLVTAHRPTGLPPIWQTHGDLRTVETLVAHLTAVQCEHPRLATVAPDDVAQAFRTAGGNVRETLFELYDLYERRSRDRASSASDATRRSSRDSSGARGTRPRT